MNALIVPQWPLPKGVAACSSTRIGGGEFTALRLAESGRALRR
ncbi:membrane protein [Salmonella enterica subsp. arizonae]|uniref:Membrane protein n=1 Tax=Salmonella enterica subsp. arizonae TaxID=59203 RepID=A0A447R053_SALER|nr:membrane protein [Salmonella enterica subsp. arizonae]